MGHKEVIMSDLDHLTHQRIDRIETKLDKLVDAVTELVRVEENIHNLTARMNDHSLKLTTLDGRIDAIEVRVPIWNSVAKIGGTIGTIVISTIVVALLSLIMIGD